MNEHTNILTLAGLRASDWYWDAESIEEDNTGTIIKISSIEPGRFKRIYSGGLHVSWFGAKGDGVTDDSQAFQNAINAAILIKSKVIIPPPKSYYRIVNTINILPPAGDQFAYVSIEGVGGQANSFIVWDGKNDSAVFSSIGWKHSIISGVHIKINSATSVIAWDIETDELHGSSSDLTFINCYVEVAPDGCVGYRLGHNNIPPADISEIVWMNCRVLSIANDRGQIGWLQEGGNTLDLKWFGGMGCGLSKLYTNFKVGGGGQGNGAAYFFGMGGSNNAIDFEIVSPQTYVISGGRYENGKRFLNVISGSAVPVITISGVGIDAYSPPDGIIFYSDKPGIIAIENCVINRQGGDYYGSKMINLDGFGGKGILSVRNCTISGPSKFYTVSNLWKVSIQNNNLLNTTSWAADEYATDIEFDGTRTMPVIINELLTHG